jgi:hypothetical protein
VLAGAGEDFMPTYLVRLIDNHDLVGVFVANDLEQLALIVDECTDPGACEFQRMKPGGLMWTSRAIPVPIELGEDYDDTEPDPVPWDAASLTESWWDSFYGFAKGKWRPIFPDQPHDQPEPPEPPQPSGPGHVVPFRKKLG